MRGCRKPNPHMLVLAIVLLAVTLLSPACNDMLLQLGESGNLSIGVGDASMGALRLSLSVADTPLSDPYVVASGDEISGQAELIDLSETNRFQNSTILYVWHLNGRSINPVPGEEETITVDSSELATGEYRLQVWAIVGLTDPISFTDEILFSVE